MTEHITGALEALKALQKQHELTLLKLGEPLLHPEDEVQSRTTQTLNHRGSDASTATDQNASVPTPASLAADLTHYRDLFTKLRFSYTEQVTKEKFLRYLVSSPAPEHISPAANAELESQLVEIKDTLKQQKAAVNDQLAQIDSHARELARRHQNIEAQAQDLRRLPEELERLQQEIEQMRQDQGIDGEPGDGQVSMGLEATVNMVEEREEQLEKVQTRLQEVEEQKSRKERELKELQEELATTERERDKAIKASTDANHRRQQSKSGIRDDVEDKGRWLKGVETTMRGLLGVEG